MSVVGAAVGAAFGAAVGPFSFLVHFIGFQPVFLFRVFDFVGTCLCTRRPSNIKATLQYTVPHIPSCQRGVRSKVNIIGGCSIRQG